MANAGETPERTVSTRRPVLSHEHEAHHGRPASWVAVSIIIIGFIVGGIAMVIAPEAWWLFWTGTGIVVIGASWPRPSRILDDWY